MSRADHSGTGSARPALSSRHAAAMSGNCGKIPQLGIRPCGRFAAGGARRHPSQVPQDKTGIVSDVLPPSLGHVPPDLPEASASGLSHSLCGGPHPVGTREEAAPGFRSQWIPLVPARTGGGHPSHQSLRYASERLKFAHSRTFPNCSRRPSLPGTGLRDLKRSTEPLRLAHEARREAQACASLQRGYS